MANDGALLQHTVGGQFGDRSYEGIVGAIEGKYGSMKDFYKQYPNVSVQPATGAHGGGGNRAATQDAIRQGIKEIEAR